MLIYCGWTKNTLQVTRERSYSMRDDCRLRRSHLVIGGAAGTSAQLIRFLIALVLAIGVATALPQGADAQPTPMPQGIVQRVAAPTNALLKTLGIANFSGGIVRQGVSALGDAPDLTFVPSNAPCPQNGGAGDVGSCVPASGGGSWRAVFPASGVDVRQFGANIDGKTDSTAAIQAAMEAIPNGGTVLLGPHLYAVSGQGLTCSHPVEMIGTESSESFLYGGYSGFRPLVNNMNILTLTAHCFGSYFGHFYLDMGAAGVNIAGASINMLGNSNVTFSDISMNAPCIGLDLNGNTITVDRMQITQVAGAGCGGIRIGHATTSQTTVDPRITNSTIQSSRSNPADYGMRIEDAGGAFISHDDILYSTIGTWIIPGANQQVKNTFFDNTTFGDTTVNSPLVIDTAAASAEVADIHSSQSWAAAFDSKSGQPGILIQNTGGASTFTGFHFVGQRVYSVPGNGVSLLAGSDFTFDDSAICGAGDQGGRPYVGIELANGLSGLAVRNSTISSRCHGSSAGHHNYQIRLDGNNTRIILTGNNFYGWVTAAISGAPTQPTGDAMSSVIMNNLGIDDQIPALTAAATIDPGVYPTVNINGAAAISRINGCWNGRKLTIRPTGGMRFTTGGNLAVALRTTDNVPVEATCIGTSPATWYLK